MKMRIDTGNVYLRPLAKRDVKQICDAVEFSRSELLPWMSWAHSKATEADTVKYIRRMQIARHTLSAYDFGIFDGKTDQYLGGCGLLGVSAQHGFAELGYWVRTDRHREGIGFAASTVLLKYGFEELFLHKVKARANLHNEASLALLIKLGFVKEGVLRDDWRVGGKWFDHVHYGMLVSEHKKRNLESKG
jgi:RimJ/RimL family protein N-acetyltransferase